MRSSFLRSAVITAFIVISAASVQAQATDPYQWVGTTTQRFNGNGGFLSMTTACRDDFGLGARMCSTVEILESIMLTPNIDECWVRPIFQPIGNGLSSTVVLDATGVYLDGVSGGEQPKDFTCNGWTTNNSSRNGLVLKVSGGFQVKGCGGNRPVACCAPIPVAEPSASLSIPTGVLGLALLSISRS
jgi:hypothetical protein